MKEKLGRYDNDQDDCETRGKKGHRLRRMQKHLPVRLQNELYGRESVVRARDERRKDREKIIKTPELQESGTLCGSSGFRCSFFPH